MSNAATNSLTHTQVGHPYALGKLKFVSLEDSVAGVARVLLVDEKNPRSWDVRYVACHELTALPLRYLNDQLPT